MHSKNNFSNKQTDIVKISLNLLLEKGYEQTKISDIMRASGLSKGGTYHYFSSKEEILDAVIKYALEEERSLFEKKLTQATSVFEQLSIFMSSDILSSSDFRNRVALWRKDEKSPYVTYRIRELNYHFALPYMQQIIKKGMLDGIFQTNYPDEMARFLYSAGEDFFYNLSDSPPSRIEAKGDAFLELIIRTLAIEPCYESELRYILTSEVNYQAKR